MLLFLLLILFWLYVYTFSLCNLQTNKKNSSAFSLADYLVKWPAKWLYFLSERSLTSLHFSYYSGFHFKITVLIQAPWHLFWNSNTKIDRQIIDRQGLADYSIENCVISWILILQFCLFLFAFFFLVRSCCLATIIASLRKLCNF